MRHAGHGEEYLDLDCSSHYLKVKGDVKVTFYTSGTQKDQKMFHFWFNTAFVPESGYLRFGKAVLDKACKDKHNKHFDPAFEVQLFFHQVADDGSLRGSAMIAHHSFVEEEEGESGADGRMSPVGEDEGYHEGDSDDEPDSVFVSAHAAVPPPAPPPLKGTEPSPTPPTDATEPTNATEPTRRPLPPPVPPPVPPL